MIRSIRSLSLFLLPLLLLSGALLAQVGADKDFPAKPAVLQPVNDYARVLSAQEAAQLTDKLTRYDRESSTSILIITIPSIGSYDVAQYATELGNRWQIGRKGKNNGVVILAAIQERRINISVGRGLEGALPDAIAGRIIRNEMTPAFKAANYYEGFSKAADAVIAATKGEYKADPEDGEGRSRGGSIVPFVVLIIVLAILFGRRGGGGGGSYMSGRGRGSWIPPVIFGGMGGWGGGGSSGGGGFGGGFGGGGGGSFGGGGASGSW